MKNKILLLFLAVLAVLFWTISASADQNGNNYWCNSDEYGCWVTDETGGKCYIMFWNEESRAYFMGNRSKPGQLVVRKPDTDSGRLMMEKPSVSGKIKLTGEACFIYCANLDWGNNPVYEKCVKQECGVDTPPNVPSEWKDK